MDSTEDTSLDRRATIRVPADLERALKRFATLSSDYLSVFTRRSVALNFAYAALAGQADMASALSSGSWSIPFEISPGCPGAFLLDRRLLFYILETFYGSPEPELKDFDSDRLLTDIEETLAIQIVEDLLSRLAESVLPNPPAENDNFPTLLSGPVERALDQQGQEGWLVRFAFGDLTEALTIILPSLRDLVSGARHGRTQSSITSGVAGNLLKASVEMAVAIGEVYSTIGEATELKIGDVLPLSTPWGNRLQISIQGAPRYWGVPTVSRGLRSIRILGSIEPDDGSMP